MPIYPNDLDIPPLQVRRALASTVSNYVAAEGEPVWATDTKKLYVGDGSTVGGIEISGGSTTSTFESITVTNTATIGNLKLTAIANSTASNILYYDTVTDTVTYGANTGGGGGANQTLNTNSNVLFNSVVTQDLVSSGGFPLDANGLALIRANNTQTPAMVVSNFTSGLRPEVVIRGYGQNRPGGAGATTAATPTIFLEASRGTQAAPTATGNGDSLFVISGAGYDGARWGSDIDIAPAQIIASATEAFAGNATTATNSGARIIMRTQPQGVQVNATSRQVFLNQGWTAGSASAPPTQFLNIGTAFNDTPTLIMSNGVDTHVGYGATSISNVNTKQFIFGVPLEDAAVFTASISGTTLNVTAVSSGVISVGQRVYATGVTTGTFITALVTGAGGTGTYTVSPSQTVSSMTMNSGADNTTLNDSNAITFISGRKSGASGRRNAIRNGDNVGRLNFNGQIANSATGNGLRAANLQVRALENFGAGARGTQMRIQTVNTGTTIEATRLELSDKFNNHYSEVHDFYNNSSNKIGTFDSTGLTFGSGSTSIVKSSSGVPLQLQNSNSAVGGKISLSATAGQGVYLYSDNGEVAEFSTASTIISTYDFKVNLFDNTEIFTASFYGARINQGTLYVGNAGIDGTVRTSAAGDSLTIQTNNGSTGGKILLDDGAGLGVKVYAQGTEVANFTTASITLTANNIFMESNLNGPTGDDFNIQADTDAHINLTAEAVRIGVNNQDATITTNGNGDLILDPSNGNVKVSTHLVPDAANTWDLGSTSTPWRSLYVSTSTIYIGNTALTASGGQLTVGGTPVSTVTMDDVIALSIALS
jgi:hypothetical protein